MVARPLWGRVQEKNGHKAKKKKREKVQWSVAKKRGLWWTPSGVEWKNAAHPVDRTGNWCIGAAGSLWPRKEEQDMQIIVCTLYLNSTCIFIMQTLHVEGTALTLANFVGGLMSVSLLLLVGLQEMGSRLFQNNLF
jgi:hypothetical protein